MTKTELLSFYARDPKSPAHCEIPASEDRGSQILVVTGMQVSLISFSKEDEPVKAVTITGKPYTYPIEEVIRYFHRIF